MLRRIALIVVILTIVIVMFTFTWRNKTPLDVDLFFASVPTTAAVAFTVAFAIGWLFGILCMSAWAVKLLNERRGLRRKLKVSESEVSSLRNLPLNDAD